MMFVIKLNLDNQTLMKLQKLTGTVCYNFLGFNLDLEKGEIKDKLGSGVDKNFSEWTTQLLSTLLTHYSMAKQTPLRGNFVKYRDIPGGYAYEGAFQKRAVQPIAQTFSQEPENLPKAAQFLGGIQRSIGDASAEINALAGIPLTFILWIAEDLPPSAAILYDSSASNYLPTEDLAVLGELTTLRLIEAKKVLGKTI
jgi:hypothetical protein